jgi:hypothetical protein
MSKKEYLKKHLINILGKKVNNRYLVIESDDWGATRIPNKVTRKKLMEEGLTRLSDPFSKYDSMETADDITSLFDVLESLNDHNGRHPVITTNFILNNPNFKAIKETGYNQYISESFIETYSKDGMSNVAWEYIKEGISKNLVKPQFHGLEHLNVIRWMNYLRNGDERFLRAFDLNCYSIDTNDENRRNNLMAAYDYKDEKELQYIKKSISNGLNQFEEIFGFRSRTTVAPCYVWNSEIEKEMLTDGVFGFQGSFVQNVPSQKSFKNIYRYNGQKNRFVQSYFVRNCLFEPSIHEDVNWIEKTMESIDIAFKWNKPAIISSHRINFSGRLDEERRNKNLELLHGLIMRCLKKYPDVNFIDSTELLNVYKL